MTQPFELRPSNPHPYPSLNNIHKYNNDDEPPTITPTQTNQTRNTHMIAPGSLRQNGAYALIDLVRVRVVVNSTTSSSPGGNDGDAMPDIAGTHHSNHMDKEEDSGEAPSLSS